MDDTSGVCQDQTDNVAYIIVTVVSYHQKLAQLHSIHDEERSNEHLRCLLEDCAHVHLHSWDNVTTIMLVWSEWYCDLFMQYMTWVKIVWGIASACMHHHPIMAMVRATIVKMQP